MLECCCSRYSRRRIAGHKEARGQCLNLEVRKPLDTVDAVGTVEAHRARPLPHDDTKRRASSGGYTVPLQLGDGQGAAGRHVMDDVIGDFRFETANVVKGVFVRSPL